MIFIRSFIVKVLEVSQNVTEKVRDFFLVFKLIIFILYMFKYYHYFIIIMIS